MSDTGDRHDNFPENKTEFETYNHQHQENARKFAVGEWRNKVAQSIQRGIVAVRNRKTFPRAK